MTKRTTSKSKKIKCTAPKADPTATPQPVPQTAVHRGMDYLRAYWWQLGLVLLIPFALYWQTTNYGYVLDDQIVITDNSFTKEGWGGIDDLLLTESFTGYFGEQKNLVQGNRYRPLSLITFAMEYGTVGGLNPWLSHFINILLYGLLGMLILRVFQLVLPDHKHTASWLSLPFMVALLYILHPIHTEAVANIKGRDEIMAMLLSMATLYYVVKADIDRKIWCTVAAAILFFLALLAKENSITFLAVIPLTLLYFRGRTWGQAAKATLPFVAVTVAYLALRFTVAGVPQLGEESQDLMNNAFLGMNGSDRMATIFYTLLKYLQLYLWPHPLSHDYYPYAIPQLTWGTWQALTALFMHLGLLAWALMGLARRTVSSYALLYYFATLTIVSNIVVNLGTFMNERFIFMASLGLTLLTVHLLISKLAQYREPFGKYLAAAILAALTIGYSYKTVTRVPDWESALTLNKSAVEGGTNSARANSFMATALYNEAKTLTDQAKKQTMLDAAYTYANKAVSIHPTYGNANLMLSGIAAELYKTHNNQTRLLADFRTVVSKRPDIGYVTEYLDYLEGRTDNMQELINWYYTLSTYDLERKPQFAVKYLLRGYRLDSANQKIIRALATNYQRIGDTANAQKFQNLRR